MGKRRHQRLSMPCDLKKKAGSYVLALANPAQHKRRTSRTQQQGSPEQLRPRPTCRHNNGHARSCRRLQCRSCAGGQLLLRVEQSAVHVAAAVEQAGTLLMNWSLLLAYGERSWCHGAHAACLSAQNKYNGTVPLTSRSAPLSSARLQTLRPLHSAVMPVCRVLPGSGCGYAVCWQPTAAAQQKSMIAEQKTQSGRRRQRPQAASWRQRRCSGGKGAGRSPQRLHCHRRRQCALHGALSAYQGRGAGPAAGQRELESHLSLAARCAGGASQILLSGLLPRA